ncbi:MAG: hypothetical protein PHP54_03330 [Clostridia bacterium]|nr:hypothetical protein [Clostridia bacterium]
MGNYNFRESYEKKVEEQQTKKDFSSSLSKFIDKFLAISEKIIYTVINFIAKH